MKIIFLSNDSNLWPIKRKRPKSFPVRDEPGRVVFDIEPAAIHSRAILKNAVD
jgi:hypothetical protein